MVRVLLSESQISERVQSLAAELDERYRDSKDLVLVGVLKGAVYFLTDLSRAMRTPHRIDFMEYGSYVGTDRKEGALRKPCADPVAGADIVLVDEVYDTGLTLVALCELLRAEGPGSLSVCVLLDKEHAGGPLRPDFVGFRIGTEFVVGYGLDHEQQYRHLPYVGVL
jgi:hypoxanthine phosphoribosyltransferase